MKETIYIQPYQSPCGELLLGSFGDKLCLCNWAVEKHPGRIDRRLQVLLDAEYVHEPSDVTREAARQLDAYFRRDKTARAGEERGQWTCRRGMPDRWWVNYECGNLKLKMRLGLTAFKHVGLFPEQAGNWHFIDERLRMLTPLLPQGEELRALLRSLPLTDPETAEK